MPPTGHASRLLPAVRRVVLVRQTAARTDGQLLAAFVADRDADAFAGLVRRHGPMVLGVCRRVVGDHAAAEDAFQAVFLVLARRAASVRPREQVGNWLYGVAYRTALKARAVQARRRSREKQVDTMPEPPAPTSPDATWSDLRPVIDEELARLPDKLRLPVVLCDLEGRPQREVAGHLGVPPATLATRLASARRLLADRLTRRGVTLSGGALAGVLHGNAAAHAVPPALADGVVRAAEQIAAGVALPHAAAGPPADGAPVSAQAVQLSEGVMRMMLVAKWKAATAAALSVMVLAGGLGFGLVPARADDGGDGPAAKPDGPTPVVVVARVAKPAPPPGAGPADDAVLLNRLCLDLRGTPATVLEQRFFGADGDRAKLTKVAGWLADDDAAKAVLAKKLGVDAGRIETVRVVAGKDGTIVEIQAVYRKPDEPKVRAVAFSPDGTKLAVEGVEDFVIGRPVRLSLTRVYDTTTGKVLTTDAFPYPLTSVTGRVVLNERTFDRKAAPQQLHTLWVQDGNAADRTVRVWDAASGKRITSRDADVVQFWGIYDAPQPQPIEGQPLKVVIRLEEDTDAHFLRRAMLDVLGRVPTALEQKYFAEDKDPKKREKLLDLLLKDPAATTRLTDEWKKKLLAPPASATPPAKPAPPEKPQSFDFRVVPYESVDRLYFRGGVRLWDVPAPDKFETLVDELLAAKKTDEQVLEAVTLAAAGRLPTAEEKRATLAVIGVAADRKAAWVKLARSLAPADAPLKTIIRQQRFVPAPKP